MKSRSPFPMLLAAATAAIVLFGSHSATAEVICQQPTAEDARDLVKTCDDLKAGQLFDCCGLSRSFIYSCSTCAAAPVADRLLESRAVLRVLGDAAKACNFNLSQVIIQELECLGIEDYNSTPLETDLR